jgi:hypothetical protein
MLNRQEDKGLLQQLLLLMIMIMMTPIFDRKLDLVTVGGRPFVKELC